MLIKSLCYARYYLVLFGCLTPQIKWMLRPFLWKNINRIWVIRRYVNERINAWPSRNLANRTCSKNSRWYALPLRRYRWQLRDGCSALRLLNGTFAELPPFSRYNISLFSSRNNRGSRSRGKLKYTNARQRSIRFTSVFALAARLIAADFNGDLNGRDFLSNSQRVQFIPMLWLISNVCRSIKEPVKVIVASGYLVGGCYNAIWFISVWIYGWYYVRLTDYIRIDVSLVQTLFPQYLSFFFLLIYIVKPWYYGVHEKKA